MTYRNGDFDLRGKIIKLVVIGDNAFISKKQVIIPERAGVGHYIEKETNSVYFGKKNELDSSNKDAIAFNAYDGYPINETWRKGMDLSVALVLKQDFSEGEDVIMHSRCQTLNITLLQEEIKNQEKKEFALFSGVKNKKEKVEELCNVLGAKLENVLYIDNELNPSDSGDKEILEGAAIVVCSESNKKYDSLGLGDRLVKVDAEGGEGLIRAFSDEFVEGFDKAKQFHHETRAVIESTPDVLKGSKDGSKKIGILIFDIDGTCTDNNKIYSVDGNEFKKFSLDDIDGIRECLNKGYKIAFITGDETSIPKNFIDYIAEEVNSITREINAKPFGKVDVKEFKELFMKECEKFESAGDKEEIFLVLGSSQRKADIVSALCEKLGFRLDEVAYMGDENNEIGIAELIIANGGVVACPSSAIQGIKETKGINVLEKRGGEGNIEEFIDHVLLKNGK
jgi:3-deoxy-D-manno-octulosonate 8-phosphate phosphatase KdsC-like HAD superfamily phosphatase